MTYNKNKIAKEKGYSGILRRLAKLDVPFFNKLKVTVCEGKFAEEKDHIFLAPLMFMSSSENLVKQNLKKTSTENIIKNPNEKKHISDRNEIKTMDYPDSSDFSDDE